MGLQVDEFLYSTAIEHVLETMPAEELVLQAAERLKERRALLAANSDTSAVPGSPAAAEVSEVTMNESSAEFKSVKQEYYELLKSTNFSKTFTGGNAFFYSKYLIPLLLYLAWKFTLDFHSNRAENKLGSAMPLDMEKELKSFYQKEKQLMQNAPGAKVRKQSSGGNNRTPAELAASAARGKRVEKQRSSENSRSGGVGSENTDEMLKAQRKLVAGLRPDDLVGGDGGEILSSKDDSDEEAGNSAEKGDGVKRPGKKGCSGFVYFRIGFVVFWL